MALRNYLYLMNGNEIVQLQQYRGDKERTKLVEKWKHMYGKKFQSLNLIEEVPEKKKKYKAVKENKYEYAGFHIKPKKSHIGSNLNKSWGYKD